MYNIFVLRPYRLSNPHIIHDPKKYQTYHHHVLLLDTSNNDKSHHIYLKGKHYWPNVLCSTRLLTQHNVYFLNNKRQKETYNYSTRSSYLMKVPLFFFFYRANVLPHRIPLAYPLCNENANLYFQATYLIEEIFLL